jgi:heat shock protein HslJ
MTSAWMWCAVPLLAAGCASGGPAASPTPGPTASERAVGPLAGTSWQVEDIDGRGVIDRVQSTLSFDAAQRVAGRAACNRYFGTYQQSDDTIGIKAAGATRMMCPPAVMDQESRFLTALGAVTTARREGDKLLLLDGSGRVRLRLRPIPGEASAAPPSDPPASSAARGSAAAAAGAIDPS